MGSGLLVEMYDEGPPMYRESSEGEDATSGEVPRGERGPKSWRSVVPCDVWREGDDEGEFEVGAEGASSGR